MSIAESVDSQWKEAMRAARGQFEHDTLLHFGDLEAELSASLRTDVFTDLSQLGIIEATGKDAGPFLHALLTSDISAIADGQSVIAAWCTPKGQVITVLRVAHHEERYLLLLPADMTDAVARRLQLYVLRRSVTLKNRSADLCRLGVSGNGLPPLCATQRLPLPNEQGQVAQDGALTAIRLTGSCPRAIFIAEREPLQALWHRLFTLISPVTPQAWTMLDILAGIPMVTRATSEKYLPQVLNLHCLGGVSFNKGCYPGQEVIARLKFRGQLKRRLYLAFGEARALAAPGSAVYDDKDRIGEVLIASPHPEGMVLLAVLPLAYREGGAIFLHEPGGIPLRLQAMPYPLEEIS